MKRIAVIVGQNMPDRESDLIVAGHDEVWIFEPLLDAVAALVDRYSYLGYINVVHCACALETGFGTLNVYNVNGLSSSLGVISVQAKTLYGDVDWTLQSKIDVHVVNLFDYLRSCGVSHITTLKIDAQGLDLTILKTLEPMIAVGSIDSIQCEADGPDVHLYDGLPPNSEPEFMAFMNVHEAYSFSKTPDRVAFNPDLCWTRTTSI